MTADLETRASHRRLPRRSARVLAVLLALGFTAAAVVVGVVLTVADRRVPQELEVQPTEELVVPFTEGERAASPSSAPFRVRVAAAGAPRRAAVEDFSARLRIEVRSAADHRPIAGARVALGRIAPPERAVVRYELVAATRTMGDGVAVLPRPDTGRLAAVVGARGHATAIRYLGRPYPERLLVELGPAGVIRGRVLLADGSPPDPSLGLRVYAWRNSGGLFPRGAALSLLPSAPVGANGEFEIDGLEPSGRYSVGGGCYGWRTSTIVRNVAPGDDVQLTLWRVFAGVMEVHGLPRASPGAMYSGWSLGFGDPEPVAGARHVFDADLFGAMPTDAQLRIQPPWSFVVRYLVADPRAELGPVRVSLDFPGFPLSVARVRVAPLERTIVRQVVELTPEARGFGTLDIRLRSPRPTRTTRVDGLLGSSLAGRVLLFGGGLRGGLSIPIRSLEQREYRVEGVPAGVYQVAFRPLALPPSNPPDGRLHIVPGGAARVEFDVSRLRDLVVQLVGPGSRDIECDAWITAERPRGGTVGNWAFLWPPYRCPGLLPGRYRITVRLHDRQGRTRRVSQVAEIQEALPVSTVRLQIPR